MAELVNRIQGLKNTSKNAILNMVEDAFPVSTNKGFKVESRAQEIINLVENVWDVK